MAKKLKILFVYDSFSPIGGGSQLSVEKWILDITRFFSKNAEVKLLTSKHSLKYIKMKKEWKNILNIVIPVKTSISLSKIYPYFSLSLSLDKEAENRIKAFKPHIIQLNELSLIDISLIELSKKINSLIGSFYHTNIQQIFFPYNLLSYYQEYIIKKTQFLFVPSEAAKKYWRNKVKCPIFIIPYPIDKNFFEKDKQKIKEKISRYEKTKKLLFIGRLSQEKHPDFLIDLLKELPKNYLLKIVGDGIMKKSLEDKIKELKLNSRVKILGWKTNKEIKELLNESHFLLLPSSFETFGLVYIEALSSFTPIITLNTEVTKEVIPENTGILIDYLNIEQWKEQILAVDKKQYEKILFNIEKSYHQLLKYEEKYSTKTLLETYAKILNSKIV